MQAVLECKQCGGQLSPEENQKIVYCKFCGSANAISVADRFGLYNRANYLRRQNEFDRAMGIYEDIIKEDQTDAEAYFGMALCKYGIEYVDDPETDKKVPTCHRTRITLMSQDEDFKKAIEYADSDTLSVYMEEATKIDIILKKIQQLSSKQEKYDVFICYKESDANGDRTQTSVLAQDIYEHLTNKGFKTFFARKTLESKLGSDYEPIIFSALYSAKVMLVIGTKPEEFQAVWVRNEWVRFMERISNADECTLIPLYKDMSPYELPNELANIQALDMGKIGYIQDLLDGIGKLIKKSSPEGAAISGVAVGTIEGSVNVSGLKKRAFLFLEQGDFKSASQYFERVLDQSPEDSESYWGKLLAKLECHNEEELENTSVPIKEMQNFQMAMRFGTDEQNEKYQRYSDLIDTRLYEEAKRREEEARIEETKRVEEEEKRKIEKEIKRKQDKKAILNLVKLSVITIVVIIIMRLLIPVLTNFMVSVSNSFFSRNYISKAEKLITKYDEIEVHIPCARGGLSVGVDKNGNVVMNLPSMNVPNEAFVSKYLYKYMEEVRKKTKGKDVNKLYSTNNSEDLIIVYADGNVDVVDYKGECNVKALSKWKNIVEMKMYGDYILGSDNTGKIYKLKVYEGNTVRSDGDGENLNWDDISEAYYTINVKEK